MQFIQNLLMPPPPKFYGVMGIYDYVDDAREAVTTLRSAGHARLRVFSPVPYHDIEKALGQGPSIVRWVAFVGGVLGFTAGMGLCIYTVVTWPLVVGGKALISVPPFIVIAYESMILLAGLANLLGLLALCRLPEVRPAAPYDPRFTEDKIGLWLPCEPAEHAQIAQIMKGHGADEVILHA